MISIADDLRGELPLKHSLKPVCETQQPVTHTYLQAGFSPLRYGNSDSLKSPFLHQFFLLCPSSTAAGTRLVPRGQSPGVTSVGELVSRAASQQRGSVPLQCGTHTACTHTERANCSSGPARMTMC